jgi:hypothetical protein
MVIRNLITTIQPPFSRCRNARPDKNKRRRIFIFLFFRFLKKKIINILQVNIKYNSFLFAVETTNCKWNGKAIEKKERSGTQFVRVIAPLLRSRSLKENSHVAVFFHPDTFVSFKKRELIQLPFHFQNNGAPESIAFSSFAPEM